jgi:hypothetical protein
MIPHGQKEARVATIHLPHAAAVETTRARRNRAATPSATCIHESVRGD